MNLSQASLIFVAKFLEFKLTFLQNQWSWQCLWCLSLLSSVHVLVWVYTQQPMTCDFSNYLLFNSWLIHSSGWCGSQAVICKVAFKTSRLAKILHSVSQIVYAHCMIFIPNTSLLPALADSEVQSWTFPLDWYFCMIEIETSHRALWPIFTWKYCDCFCMNLLVSQSTWIILGSQIFSVLDVSFSFLEEIPELWIVTNWSQWSMLRSSL